MPGVLFWMLTFDSPSHLKIWDFKDPYSLFASTGIFRVFKKGNPPHTVILTHHISYVNKADFTKEKRLEGKKGIVQLRET